MRIRPTSSATDQVDVTGAALAGHMIGLWGCKLADRDESMQHEIPWPFPESPSTLPRKVIDQTSISKRITRLSICIYWTGSDTKTTRNSGVVA